MKLVLAVVHNDDAGELNQELTKEGFFATKLATTGGFLKEGNTTMIIGVEKEKVDKVLGIIENNCRERIETITPAVMSPFGTGVYANLPQQVRIGGATVFVLDIERFEKL